MSNPTPAGDSKTPRTDIENELRLANVAVEIATIVNAGRTSEAVKLIEKESSELAFTKLQLSEALAKIVETSRGWMTEVAKIGAERNKIVSELTDARATIQGLEKERDEWRCSAKLYHSELRDLAEGKKVETNLAFPVEQLIRGLTAERDALQQKLAEAEKEIPCGFYYDESLRNRVRIMRQHWEKHQIKINALTTERDALAALVKVKDAALERIATETQGLRLRYKKADESCCPLIEDIARAALSLVTTAHVDSSAAPRPPSDSDAPSA